MLRNILHTRVVCGAGGGPEKTILNSPRFLKPYGYNCLCAYMYPPSDEGFGILQHRAQAADCPLTGIEDRGALDFSVIRQLLNICRENNIQIWHAHDYKSNAIGLLLRRFHKMKLVTTVHGWVHHTAKTPLYYAIDKYCLRLYDKVICVSTDLFDQCQKLGVKSSNLVLIENAIDTDEFCKKSVENPVNSPIINIGAVGRLAEEKGFIPLIETVVKLSKKYTNIRLSIYGQGPQQSELEAAIDRLNARQIVFLPGFAQDLIQLYSSLDIFILNSIREGLPNVCLEAMSMEVPMIATAVAGVPHLVTDSVDGLIIPIGDTAALEQALIKLIDSPTLRLSLAQQARKTVVEKFSFEKRMEKIRHLYESLG